MAKESYKATGECGHGSERFRDLPALVRLDWGCICEAMNLSHSSSAMSVANDEDA